MGSVTIRTRPITREKLARFFPGNHELVRLLESLVQDVVINIPDTVNTTTVVVDETNDEMDTLRALGNAARDVAVRAFALAVQSNEGPPPAAVVLPDAPDDLYAQVAALRERVAIAERRIAELKEGPTP